MDFIWIYVEMFLLIFAMFLKAPDHETYTKMCAQDVAFTAQSISQIGPTAAEL